MKAIKIPVRKFSSPVTRSGSVDCPAVPATPQAAQAGDDLAFYIPANQTLYKIGDEIKQRETIYVCNLVNQSNARFVNIKNSAEVIHVSNCHDCGVQLNFSAGKVQPVTDKPKQTGNQKTMAKEKTGKIEFIDTLYLKGGKTKAEIAALAGKEFEMEEATARNTTNWCASTFKTRNPGKTPKFIKPEGKADKPAKKPAAKKPAAKKKSPAKKKVSVPKRKPAEPAPATNPEPTPA